MNNKDQELASLIIASLRQQRDEALDKLTRAEAEMMIAKNELAKLKEQSGDQSE